MINPFPDMTRYKHLYIYQVEGEVNDQEIVSPEYIGCWNEGDTSFLFFHSDHRRLVEDMVRQNRRARLIDAYDMEYEAWQGGKLAPFRVGPLWFRPPFVETTPPEGCYDIPFDPGVVFGTGLHPTTADCLHLLVDFFRENTPQRVLDLGTGTGILSIAAALMGAREVLAVDINRLSVSTARRNVGLNHLADRVRVMEADALEAIHEEADLALMNIHFSALDAITNDEAFYRKKWVILSGVLRSDYYTLLKKLQKRRHLAKERQTGHWFSAWFEV